MKARPTFTKDLWAKSFYQPWNTYPDIHSAFQVSPGYGLLNNARADEYNVSIKYNVDAFRFKSK